MQPEQLRPIFVCFRDHYVANTDNLKEFADWVRSDFDIRVQEFALCGWLLSEDEHYLVLTPVIPFLDFEATSKMNLQIFFIHKGSVVLRRELAARVIDEAEVALADSDVEIEERAPS